jgi:DNA-binding response OmpR family regulator
MTAERFHGARLTHATATTRASLYSERHASETLIPLRRALWLDLEAGLILRGRTEVPLTARELAALTALARAMRLGRGYLSAKALADALVDEQAYDPVHAIQETVCSIRRKLGERPYKPAILRCRRGLGYRLFPDARVNT